MSTTRSSRRFVAILAAVIAGVAVYYLLLFALTFVIFNVLGMSVSTADLRSLFIFALVKLLPLACAILAGVLVHGFVRRPKHE